MKHPYIAYKVGKVKDGATNISTIASNFEINIAYAANLKRDEDGTPGNAIRHTLWQAIITRDYGTDEARHIGNVHEDNHDLDLNQRIFNDMKPADSTVDLLNNIIGRELGRKNPNATNVELAKKVMEEFLKNGLWTVENINGEYRIQKTRITQEEYESAIKEINKKNENGKNN